MSPPDQLIEGAPAPDGECWFRVIVDSEFISKKDSAFLIAGLLGNGGFRNSGLHGYSHELSGRITSLAGDIQAIVDDANARIDAIRRKWTDRGRKPPSRFKFMGVVCATAAELRTVIEQFPTNVIFTPINGIDPAHSDFVALVNVDDELDNVRVALARTLRLIRPEQLAARLQACGL